MKRRRFALDQNFPETLLDLYRPFIKEADLVPIREIDPRLVKAQVDDWRIMIALRNDPRGWDGLITNDAEILSLPIELAVLCQTKLTLVVLDGVGHDPVRASGLLLAHLPQICRKTAPRTPQIWLLRAPARNHAHPWETIKRLAMRRGITPRDLFRMSRIAPEVLRSDPLIGLGLEDED